MDSNVEALLNGKNFGNIATVSIDGTPRADTVWYLYREGTIYVATSVKTVKSRNLDANGAAHFTVFNLKNPYEQAQMSLRLISSSRDKNMDICDAISFKYIGRRYYEEKDESRIVYQFCVANPCYSHHEYLKTS